MMIHLPILFTLLGISFFCGVLVTLFVGGAQTRDIEIEVAGRLHLHNRLYVVEYLDRVVRIDSMLWRAVQVAESKGADYWGISEIIEYNLRDGWYQAGRELHHCAWCGKWEELQTEYPQRGICVRCATTGKVS